jgi:hypothetical protein
MSSIIGTGPERAKISLTLHKDVIAAGAGTSVETFDFPKFMYKHYASNKITVNLNEKQLQQGKTEVSSASVELDS